MAFDGHGCTDGRADTFVAYCLRTFFVFGGFLEIPDANDEAWIGFSFHQNSPFSTFEFSFGTLFALSPNHGASRNSTCL